MRYMREQIPARFRLNSNERLIAFVMPFGVTGVAIWVLLLSHLGPVESGPIMPLWLYFPMCVAGTFFVIEVQVQRTFLNFSLTEVPIVLGLVLLAPIPMILCYVLGVYIAHVFRRGPVVINDVANLCLDTFYLSLTTLVFRAMSPEANSPLGLRTLIALAVAMAVAAALGPGLMNLSIWIEELAVNVRAFLRTLAFQVVASLVNSCLAITGMVFAVDHPILLLVLAPPAALVFTGQLASFKQQHQAKRMQFTYEISELLHSSGNLITNSGELVDHMVDQFRAGRAELIMLADRSRALHVYSHLKGDRRTETRDLTLREHDLVEYMLAANRTTVSTLENTPPELTRLLRDRDQQFGGAALLRGAAAPLGMILLFPPTPEQRRFLQGELALLHSVAGQVAVALEKGQLADEVRAMSIEKQELNHRLFHDPLTRLANRALFNDRVGHALTRAGRVGDPIAVMFIDLDDFKGVNDTHGHGVGDELLVSVAERLNQCLRAADTAARFGGDEFGLLLEHVKTTDDVIVVAERLVSSLSLPHRLGALTVSVRASVGVAIIVPGEELGTVPKVLEWADTAMYAAKRRGKGSYAIFEPGMDGSVSERLTFEVEMRRALATAGELFVQYQPIVDIETRQLKGVEALVRWNHPTKGNIPPASFIPLAETTGFILPLGRWVLIESCRQAVKWRDLAPGRLCTVSVNVSARELLSDDFNDVVNAALADTGLEPSRLIIEVTESVLLNDLTVARERLCSLREAGIKVALDDFGTGFSSLSYLHDLPVDLLKIDRCFLAKRRSDGRHREFLRAIYTLGRSLGLITVAEGVEDLEDLELLMLFGVDRAQGFYFSEPIDADRVTPMLTRQSMIAAGLAP